MTARARVELARGRQLIIFPEGTRQAGWRRTALQVRRGAAICRGRRALRSDCAQFRAVLAAPLDPAAAGDGASGDLDPIAPGLDKDVFFERLKHDIETATARLIADAKLD